MLEIPGFYFDPAQNKYFRVQQSHNATPGASSKYTAQSIQIQKRDEAKRAAEAKRETRRRRETVHRLNPGSGLWLLYARLGARKHVQRRVAEGWALGLKRRSVERGTEHIASAGFVGETFSIGSTGTLRTAYVFPTPDGGAPSFGSYSRVVSATSTYQNFPIVSTGNRGGSGARTNDPFVLDSNCVYRDISDHCPANLITTLYNHGHEYAIVTCEGQENNCLTIRSLNGQGEPSEDLGHIDDVVPDGNTMISRVWDVAGAPDAPVFALATSTGLIRGQCREDLARSSLYSATARGAKYTTLSQAETMNVSFKDNNIVMAGTRSGRVLFADIRGRFSVGRLLHSSAVLGTVALPDTGGNHVLVHGYSSTTVYDLRFINQTPVSRKSRSSHVSRRSQPYTSFAVPENRTSDHYTRGRKVAYSADLGVVVALSSNSNGISPKERGRDPPGFVTLYSVNTGKVIDSPLTRHQYSCGVRSVDVRRLRDGPESVLVLNGDGLDEWTVEEFGDDKEAIKVWREDRFDQFYHDYRRVPIVVHELGIEQAWDRGNGVIGRIRR